MQLSRQAHDREICLNPAVAILRRTSHCAETARFLPPFFLAVHNTPWCTQKRDSASVPRDTQSEVRAGRLSGRFRLRAYRTVQIRPVSSRSVHHGIFPDVYFYTQSLQRPHERRPMASRREQVSALFFVAWTQRRLTECFSWATEGPYPPQETLTFKKEFFFGKQLRDHYPRALNNRLLAMVQSELKTNEEPEESWFRLSFDAIHHERHSCGLSRLVFPDRNQSTCHKDKTPQSR